MSATVHLCLGPAVEDGKASCRCCGEAVSPNDSAPGGFCWQCGFGSNPQCARCVAAGVPFHRFRGKPSVTKMHRLAVPVQRGEVWDAACGRLSLPSNEVGMATAVAKTYCRKCWPEETRG